MFLFIELTALGIIIFCITVIAFAFAVRFFLDSRKHLQQYMNTGAASSLVILEPVHQRGDVEEKKSKTRQTAYKSSELEHLREMLHQQQRQMESVLAQLNLRETNKSADTDERTASELNMIISKKDAEIKSLRQQLDLTKEIQSHFDELQGEVDFLQEKLHGLEEQAWQAKEMSIKLDAMEQSQEHLEKELLRKEEKLLELTAENQRLNAILNSTEDKLQESNMQRMQLQKKAQFLEEMNNDMKQVSDTNRKLQNEIRRIAELESMLNLIMQERDELLRQRYK